VVRDATARIGDRGSISASVGLRRLFKSATALMIMPDWQ
jgi:hypothetical protein